MSERYGVPSSTVGTDNKGFAAVGYGKSGGIELSYSSDLDLLFIHNSCPEEVTTGNRQILASVFYMKMAQRIMHICNTRMGSGQLYEIDMRLRPSGNSGLLVVHIDAFEKYQQQEAWTWEHQALVRARVIYGNSQLTHKFNLIRTSILTQERDPDKLKQEVLEMRNKMRSHLDKSVDHHIDIKQGIGGLVDIEFLAQYLVLKNGSYHPEIALYSDNIRIFMSLAAAGVITENQGSILTQGYCQLRDQGHRAILQGKKVMLDEEAFEQYSKNIQAVWKFFL
jgi:glutamate-ammonia-ligase adenylyltransferase